MANRLVRTRKSKTGSVVVVDVGDSDGVECCAMEPVSVNRSSSCVVQLPVWSRVGAVTDGAVDTGCADESCGGVVAMLDKVVC